MWLLKCGDDKKAFLKFQADVVVEPNQLSTDEPYTEQFGKCGERGEKIHLTPDFLAGKALKQYGPQGIGMDKMFYYITHSPIIIFQSEYIIVFFL